MEIPSRIWLALAIAIGICIRGAILLQRRYLNNNRRADNDEVDETTLFEKDVEDQLQHELRSAVDAAATSTPIPTQPPQNEGMLETTPLLQPFSPPPPQQQQRVVFTDSHLTANSWHGFKAYSRAELPRVELVHQSLADQPGPVAMNGVRLEQPLCVNPKQFHRILKRRMTRQLMEEYFRSRLDDIDNEIVESRIPRGRRPRGSQGRFLNAEEVERMAGEGVVVA